MSLQSSSRKWFRRGGLNSTRRRIRLSRPGLPLRRTFSAAGLGRPRRQHPSRRHRFRAISAAELIRNLRPAPPPVMMVPVAKSENPSSARPSHLLRLPRRRVHLLPDRLPDPDPSAGIKRQDTGPLFAKIKVSFRSLRPEIRRGPECFKCFSFIISSHTRTSSFPCWLIWTQTPRVQMKESPSKNTTFHLWVLGFFIWVKLMTILYIHYIQIKENLWNIDCVVSGCKYGIILYRSRA